jgi:homopolymeric O-antigen transport system permease protein
MINLFQSWDLLREWTSRNIRARYQQSVLGWFWAIIQPAAQAAIYTVVFTLVVRVDTGNIPYVLFSYLAMVPWTLLATSLVDMSNSLVDNMSLVNKIYFPREVLPVAAMLARLMDFGVAALLIVILMVIYRTPVFAVGILFLPVILSIQLILMLGIGLATAAANVFVRDIRSLMVLGIQLWFYATPIIYPASAVPENLRPYYFLNPMNGIIEAYRDVLLRSQVPGPYLLSSVVISLFIFALGYWFFKRVEFQFADIV